MNYQAAAPVLPPRARRSSATYAFYPVLRGGIMLSYDARDLPSNAAAIEYADRPSGDHDCISVEVGDDGRLIGRLEAPAAERFP